MAHAFFNHDTHRPMRCVECHAGIDAAPETSALHMPGQAACQRCHAPAPKGSGASSTCTTCHTYHDKTRRRPGDGRQPIGEVSK